MAVEAVNQADHLGKIGALHMAGGFGRESLESGSVCVVVAFHGGRNVLVAKVENGKGEALRVAGDGAGHMRAAQGEAAAA